MVQMWQGWAHSRRKCADVARRSPSIGFTKFQMPENSAAEFGHRPQRTRTTESGPAMHAERTPRARRLWLPSTRQEQRAKLCVRACVRV
jgi:hypothetical protein